MKEIVFAGFGGQGILTAGMLLAYIAASAGLQPVWMPSYGAIMRGGTANCVVKYSDDPNELVGSPAMEEIDVLAAMNEPSLRFMELCKPEASVFVNGSALRRDYAYPADRNIIVLDCLAQAERAGSPKSANLVMLGAVLAKCRLFDEEIAVNAVARYFTQKDKGKFNELNEKALRAGYAAMR